MLKIDLMPDLFADPRLDELARLCQADTGWVMRRTEHDDGRLCLEPQPERESAQTMHFWFADEMCYGEMDPIDQVAPVESYLDPHLRQQLISHALDLLDPSDEGLRGFAAGSLLGVVEQFGSYTIEQWRQVGYESRQLHLDMIDAAAATLSEFGQVEIDPASGRVRGRARIAVGDSIEENHWRQLIGKLGRLLNGYTTHGRLAYAGAWNISRDSQRRR